MATCDGWVVVGLDNGGNSHNATVLDAAGTFLVDRLVESAQPGHRGPGGGDRGARRGRSTDVLGAAPASPRDAGARGRPGHARPGQRRRGHLVAGLDQLRPPGLARLRRPRRARGAARPAGDLQQRRQRRRALRAPLALRPDADAALVGLGDRRHRPRRRRDRERARSSRAPPGWPASSATCTSRWTACSARASRCRCATAASPATRRASPR